MTSVFLREPWEQIRSALVSPNRKRAHCAIGYLGPTADEVLPIGRGDVLVCDASDWAVRRGATSTLALERFVQAGVDVYTCTCLHAKVVVLAKRAYIGSMNASRNSRDALIEAAILTTDTAAVQEARQFVLDNAQRHVDMDEVKRLRKLDPKKPAFVHSARKGVPSRTPPGLDEVLLLPTERGGWTRAAEDLAKKNRPTALAENRALGTRAQLTDMQDEGRTPLRKGDWVIRIAEDQKRAFGPECVAHVAARKTTRVVWLSRPSDVVVSVPLATLEAAVAGEGVRWDAAEECRLQKSAARAAVDLFRR